MHDVIVRCGCTRKMSLDAVRGRGAYRCGCGARIQIIEPPRSPDHCVALVGQSGCRQSLSTVGSVPLCRTHLKAWKAELGLVEATDMNQYVQHLSAISLGLETKVNTEADGELQRTAHLHKDKVTVKRGPQDAEGSVVYYLRFDTRIKIGTTTDLPKRLLAVPNDELLAIEPGGVMLERRRHQQFEALRLRGEWFSMGEDLMRHIEELRRRSSEYLRA